MKRALAMLLLVPALACAASPEERLHAALSPMLSPQQARAVEAHLPGYRVLAACGGADALMLALRAPDGTIRRAGVLREPFGMQVRDVERDIERDRAVSRHSPLTWQADPARADFAQRTKCDADPRRDADLGDGRGKPHGSTFFALPPESRTMCFATDDAYNNWDCIAYSKRDGRFRLWYQQVFAD